MNDNILILLTVLVAANTVLLAVVVSRSILRRRRADRFVASLPPVDSGRSIESPPTESSAQPDGQVPEGVSGSTVPVDTSPAPPRVDALTGLLLPAEWNRILGDEDARLRRYGRPATVVLLELDGIDRLIATLGQAAGDRVLPAVADALSRQARAADHLARLGPGRFGVLLTETGEVEAVNYVERVRSACELWLESGAVALRLAIGWAAPPVDGTLGDAFATAQDRMFSEVRRNARHAADAIPPLTSVTSEDVAGSPSAA